LTQATHWGYLEREAAAEMAVALKALLLQK
jgi:hypothetical protein